MKEYIISLAVGYFAGSLPTAYLLVKRKAHLDIRHSGSGNVGARNSYDLTGSLAVGGAVLVSDVLKGVAAVWLSAVIVGAEYRAIGMAGVAAVLGHNYSPWIGFKGGRGIATAMGVMLMLGWGLVPIWCAIWLVAYYATSKNIHLGNVIACAAAPWLLLFLPEQLRAPLLAAPALPVEQLVVSVLLCGLIVIRHREPLRALMNPHQQSSPSQT